MSVRVRATLMISLTAVLLLMTLLFAGIVSAQTGPVQLSITPDTLALSPGEKATVLILASISTTNLDSLKPMTITLSSFTGTGVDLHFPTNAKQQVTSRGGDIFWLTEIVAGASGVSPGKLYIMAEYALADAGGQIISRTTTITLGITDRPAEAVTDVLSVTMHSDIETLLDLQKRNAIFVLTNISNVPVTVTDVVPTLTISNTQQLSATVVTRSRLPISLQPQQTQEISVALGVGSSIVAGNNLIVARVDAKWMRGKFDHQGSIVVTKAFQSGVFGESAILTAVGVPTLLLLPGFLMMVGFWLFYQTFRPLASQVFRLPPAATPEPTGFSLKDFVQWAKPEVWFWAITFSLVLFLMYPSISGPCLSLLTGKSQQNRDLLTGYGFIDIVDLWLIAALSGIIFAVIGAWLFPFIQYLRRYWLERFTPTSNDNAITILNKLVRNGNRDFKVEKRLYNGKLVYMLPEAIHVPGKVWVTPLINAERGANPPKDFNQEFRSIYNHIEDGGEQEANVLEDIKKEFRKIYNNITAKEWKVAMKNLMGVINSRDWKTKGKILWKWVRQSYFKLTFDSGELETIRKWIKKKYLRLAFDLSGEVKGPTLIDEANLVLTDQISKSILDETRMAQ